MSRGFDGFEIDDFRSPELDADRGSDRTPHRDWKSIERLNRVHREEDRADRLEREQQERHNTDRPSLPREDRQRIPSERVRTKYVDRNKTYSLRDSEIHTLTELGTFRVIAENDLAELGYAKDRSRMEHDIESLQKQGLVQQRTIEETDYPTTRVLALTKQGHRLLSRGNLLPRDQSTYHGFAKPKEARHDADLYRLYHKVAREIESKGGRVVRVKLDYELKRKLYRDLERTARDTDMETAKKEVAERHHLKVVHGKIAVPDMRIEYVQDDMMIQRRDLELATDHYRPRGLAAKARAGFQIYARRADVDRLRRIRDDRELSAAIFSL